MSDKTKKYVWIIAACIGISIIAGCGSSRDSSSDREPTVSEVFGGASNSELSEYQRLGRATREHMTPAQRAEFDKHDAYIRLEQARRKPR